MVSRRDFLKISTAAAGTAALTLSGAEKASASTENLASDRFGVLVDFTLCIGCRRCEWACSKGHDLPHGNIDDYEDVSVFNNSRRPGVEDLTVVNQYPAKPNSRNPLSVKVNCLHCEKPACVSACIVGALEKSPQGPVIYDAWKCIGCRYCMIACPFQIPAYEYDNALTPKVQKCDFCSDLTLGEGNQLPACVDICPTEALLFGKRTDLLKAAENRIRKNPEKYFDKVFGKDDAGGTSWFYIGDRDFSEVDFPDLPDSSPAHLTESIQHGIFRGFSGPAMVLGLMSVILKSTKKIPPEKDLPSKSGAKNTEVDHG